MMQPVIIKDPIRRVFSWWEEEVKKKKRLQINMEAFKKIYPDEYYRKFLVHSIRPDGRTLTAIRKTIVSAGTLSLLQALMKKVPSRLLMVLLL